MQAQTSHILCLTLSMTKAIRGIPAFRLCIGMRICSLFMSLTVKSSLKPWMRRCGPIRAAASLSTKTWYTMWKRPFPAATTALFSPTTFWNFISAALRLHLLNTLSAKMNCQSAVSRKTWIGANRFYLCFPALQTLKTERLRFMPMRCFACSPRFGSKCAETFGCQAKTQIPLWALGCRNFYST